MKKRRKLMLGVLAAPWLACLLACGGETRPNVLLISIDTLRADHLGVYGYSRDTSPALDRLAEESIVFANAFSPAPRTLPSHVMMLTGNHPYRMGISHGGDQSTIPSDARIVSEILQESGYQTVAFVDSSSSGWLGSRRGFARGFDAYHHAPHRDDLFYDFDTAASVDAATEWLDGQRDGRPFFMFLHTKSVHAIRADTPRPDDRIFPYDKPAPYRFRFVADEDARFTWSAADLGAGTLYLNALNKAYFHGTKDPGDFPKQRIETLKALYDNGIAYTDHHLGRFFDALRSRGLMDDTILIVTSDHGEAFLEHGFFKHGITVYREMLHVPLILRIPGTPGRRSVAEAVSIGDVPPTILQQLGIPVPPEMEGRPLIGDAADANADRPLFAFIKHRLTPATGAAIRQGDWRLIYDRTRADGGAEARLYHVSEDPEELHPVPGEGERAARMLTELLDWRDRGEVKTGPGIEIDEKTLEHLRAVGYIE
ncbi:MAG: sulfatase [Myxococcales bacterium]|nr:sulfatase [Myxococcales bacterium]